jgi:UDP-2,3-diacylglucosamine pyrophosphatase LpxH
MPDIKYIVLSDMHLGAENSLLTNIKTGTVETDPTKASPVLIKLVECIKQIVSKDTGPDKPKLILNGDLIELALTSTSLAAMSFQRFIEEVMPESGEWIFDKEIIFIPGNHDHRLWETARVTEYYERLEDLKVGCSTLSPRHVTHMFNPEDVRSVFLTSLIRAYPHLKDVTVNIAYPSYAVLNNKKDRCVIFNHGLYVESMYSLMTNLRGLIFPDRMMPLTVEELETENFAWIDFFWSELGRSGSVGKDINLIYDKLQDQKQVNIMISNIAKSISSKNKNFISRWLQKKGLEAILQLTVGKMAASERNEPDIDLSPDAAEGLKKFMEIQILNQLTKERGENNPRDFTFIFGHTHKPFEREMDFKGYPGKVKVFNSGGWVVDTMSQQPLHGGSVILVDEHLDTLSLHMYKEGNYKVTFEDCSPASALNKNDLYTRLASQINLNEEPWTGFEKVVEEQVAFRYRDLKTIVNSNSL